ncbi:MAG: DUF86 domain-containing protein [Planctomycetes bacterium]|nr:DUF86 domain-containing protein [Planctomycetota bacterium]MCB9936563.1 DUF86 domain-containing protein [Planctomycetota bacterium]
MQRDPHVLLEDVFNACRLIEKFVGDTDFNAYRHNEMLRSAVERQFSIAGEALNVIRGGWPAIADDIQSIHAVIGFRNILIHGYSIVDHEVVWRIIKDHVPVLIKDVTALLAAGDRDE